MKRYERYARTLRGVYGAVPMLRDAASQRIGVEAMLTLARSVCPDHAVGSAGTFRKTLASLGIYAKGQRPMKMYVPTVATPGFYMGEWAALTTSESDEQVVYVPAAPQPTVFSSMDEAVSDLARTLADLIPQAIAKGLGDRLRFMLLDAGCLVEDYQKLRRQYVVDNTQDAAYDGGLTHV